jgi:hypothetical protein
MKPRAAGGITQMNVSEFFEVAGDYAVARPVVECTVEEAKDLISAALVMAREKKITRLLLDIRGLTGFEPPSVVDRYFYVKEWAKAGCGQVRAAFVAVPQMIDPQRFGVIAARNVGLIANIFENEKEAMEWLLKDGF